MFFAKFLVMVKGFLNLKKFDRGGTTVKFISKGFSPPAVSQGRDNTIFAASGEGFLHLTDNCAHL